MLAANCKLLPMKVPAFVLTGQIQAAWTRKSLHSTSFLALSHCKTPIFYVFSARLHLRPCVHQIVRTAWSLFTRLEKAVRGKCHSNGPSPYHNQPTNELCILLLTLYSCCTLHQLRSIKHVLCTSLCSVGRCARQLCNCSEAPNIAVYCGIIVSHSQPRGLKK